MNIIKYIKDFVFLNLKDYSNISIDFPIGIFLIVLTLALCIACFLLNYYRIYTVHILKQLIRRESVGEENAKTLKELKLDNSFVIKMLLSSEDGLMPSLVKKQGEIKMTYEEYIAMTKKKGYKKEKIDFSSAKFYIPKEKVYRAKKTIDTDTSSHLKPILFVLMFFALLVCIAILLPSLLDYINNSLN